VADRPGDETPSQAEHPTEEQPPRLWRELPILLIAALAIAIVVKTFLVQAFYIPSISMSPTLEKGDRILVCRICVRVGDIHRGDVIVFSDPHPAPGVDRGPIGATLHWLGEGIGVAQPENEDFIKRVIALPGETIEIRHDVVYIDGEPLDEPYLTQAAKDATGDYPLHTVPDDALFVMGDNRGNSLDSRFSLGYVPISKVVGEAFVVIWPPTRAGLLH
jgi:signal peptidase I